MNRFACPDEPRAVECCTAEDCNEPCHLSDVCKSCNQRYCGEHLVHRHKDLEQMFWIAGRVADGKQVDYLDATNLIWRKDALCSECWDYLVSIGICPVCALPAHTEVAYIDGEWQTKCGPNEVKTHPNIFVYLTERGLVQNFVTELARFRSYLDSGHPRADGSHSHAAVEVEAVGIVEPPPHFFGGQAA